MKKFIFIVLAVFLVCIFSFKVNAKDPKSAVCGPFKGERINIADNKEITEKDAISSKISYVFVYADKKILDNDGNSYLMLKEDSAIIGILHAQLADNLISFYPDEGRVIMSKHSYFKGFSIGSGIDISAWTMSGKCEFEY